MPVDGKVFCEQSVVNLNNNCVTLLSLDGGSWSFSIDCDNKLLKAIRGPILILHLPFVMSISGLCIAEIPQNKEETQNQQCWNSPCAERKLNHA